MPSTFFFFFPFEIINGFRDILDQAANVSLLIKILGQEDISSFLSQMKFHTSRAVRSEDAIKSLYKKIYTGINSVGWVQ